MESIEEEKTTVSPLQLVHFTKNWIKEEEAKGEDSYLNREDVFFDSYSNTTILFN
jgi:hypothetical protein